MGRVARLCHRVHALANESLVRLVVTLGIGRVLPPAAGARLAPRVCGLAGESMILPYDDRRRRSGTHSHTRNLARVHDIRYTKHQIRKCKLGLLMRSAGWLEHGGGGRGDSRNVGRSRLRRGRGGRRTGRGLRRPAERAMHGGRGRARRCWAPLSLSVASPCRSRVLR